MQIFKVMKASMLCKNLVFEVKENTFPQASLRYKIILFEVQEKHFSLHWEKICQVFMIKCVHMLARQVREIIARKCHWKLFPSQSFPKSWTQTSGMYILWGAVIMRSIFPKSSQKTHHSLPVRVRYGVFVVILISDSLSATVIAVS